MKNATCAEENNIENTEFRNLSIAFIIWDGQIHILGWDIILHKQETNKMRVKYVMSWQKDALKSLLDTEREAWS